VAVIHCVTGRSVFVEFFFIVGVNDCSRGRTIVTIACYLTFIGNFPSTKEAIEYILSVQNLGIQQLIPSQEL